MGLIPASLPMMDSLEGLLMMKRAPQIVRQMKTPYSPQHALHTARRLQRERPGIRMSPAIVVCIAASIVFWIAMAVIAIRYFTT
jgi:hypothetical protein